MGGGLYLTKRKCKKKTWNWRRSAFHNAVLVWSEDDTVPSPKKNPMTSKTASDEGSSEQKSRTLRHQQTFVLLKPLKLWTWI